jgi:putative transcriptional regulator
VSLHHPYDDTLARYSAGRLGAGPSLVASVHLSGCAECRARVAVFEAAGGVLLEETPAAAVRPELFAASLKRIERAEDPGPARKPRVSPLDNVAMSPWRTVGGGFSWRRLTLPHAPHANVMMIKVRAGQRMPHHTHVGTEYTQVMQGSFHDDFGRYSAGDCVEADDDIDHQPIVDSDIDCICLAAVEGRLRLRGWLARMVQPLLGL